MENLIIFSAQKCSYQSNLPDKSRENDKKLKCRLFNVMFTFTYPYHYGWYGIINLQTLIPLTTNGVIVLWHTKQHCYAEYFGLFMWECVA